MLYLYCYSNSNLPTLSNISSIFSLVGAGVAYYTGYKRVSSILTSFSVLTMMTSQVFTGINMDATDSGLQSYQRKADLLSDEVKLNSSKLSDLQNSLQSNINYLAPLAKNASNINSSVGQVPLISNSLNNLNSSLNSVKDDVNTLSSNLNSISSNLDGRITSLSDNNNQQISDLNDKLTTSINSSNQQISDLNNKVDQQDSSLSNLENKTADLTNSLQNQITTLKGRSDNQDSSLTNLGNQITVLDTNLQQNSKLISSCQSSISDQQNTINNQSQDITTLKGDTASLQQATDDIFKSQTDIVQSFLVERNAQLIDLLIKNRSSSYYKGVFYLSVDAITFPLQSSIYDFDYLQYKSDFFCLHDNIILYYHRNINTIITQWIGISDSDIDKISAPMSLSSTNDFTFSIKKGYLKLYQPYDSTGVNGFIISLVKTDLGYYVVFGKKSSWVNTLERLDGILIPHGILVETVGNNGVVGQSSTPVVRIFDVVANNGNIGNVSYKQPGSGVSIGTTLTKYYTLFLQKISSSANNSNGTIMLRDAALSSGLQRTILYNANDSNRSFNIANSHCQLLLSQSSSSLTAKYDSMNISYKYSDSNNNIINLVIDNPSDYITVQVFKNSVLIKTFNFYIAGDNYSYSVS